MKIAFISFYSGSVNRGVEVFVDELASRLTMKHEVHLYQTGNPKLRVSYKIIKIPMRVNWKKKDMTGTFARRIFVDYWSRLLAFMSLRIFTDIVGGRYDIVVPLNGGWQTVLMRIATWIYGGKMVVAGQSGVGWDDRINLYCFPNAFVALSKKALAWSSNINSLVKSVLISNGVDLAKFKPQGEKFKSYLKGPLVLSVGAFTKQKRLDLVIKAVSKLEGVNLLIVGGGGNQENKLKEMGENLLGNKFGLMQVKHGEMPKVYRSANVFVLVSEASEAFGIAFIEAMASGLPVVAVDDKQRREIIGNAGLFVKDPHDIDNLAHVIRGVLDKKRGSEPRKRSKKFDWDDVSRKYEKLFSNLMVK